MRQICLVFSLVAALLCGCKSSTAPQLFYTMNGLVKAVDTVQSTYGTVVTYNASGVAVERLDSGSSGSMVTNSDGTFTFADIPGGVFGVSLSKAGYASSRLYSHLPNPNVPSAILYPPSWLAATLGDPQPAVDSTIDTTRIGVVIDSLGDTTNHGTLEFDTIVYHNGFTVTAAVRSVYPGRVGMGEVMFYISTHDSINPLDPGTFDFTYNNSQSDSGNTIVKMFNSQQLYAYSLQYTGKEYPSGTRVYIKAYVSPYKQPQSYSYPGSLKRVYPFLGLYPSNTISFTLP